MRKLFAIAAILASLAPGTSFADGPESDRPLICVQLQTAFGNPVVCSEREFTGEPDYLLTVIISASTSVELSCPRPSVACDGGALGRTGFASYSVGHAAVFFDEGQADGPAYHPLISHRVDIYYYPSPACIVIDDLPPIGTFC